MGEKLHMSRSTLSFSTQDPTTATSYLRTHFGENVFEIQALEGPNPFSVQLKTAIVGSTRLLHASVEGAMEKASLDGHVRIIVPLSGELRLQVIGREYVAKSGQNGVVIHPHETFELKVRKGRGVALHTPARNLFEHAEKLAQSDIATTGELAREFLLSAPASAALVRNLQYYISELLNLDAIGMSPLVVDSYEETLLNLAAAAVYPALTDKLNLPKTNCGSAQVVTARDYLRENADGPVDLLALANELGMSMRTLQENFKRCQGVAPREYLMQCRLENARAMLVSTTNALNVTQVATECGFSDLGRFSARYRARFGELPSETHKRRSNPE